VRPWGNREQRKGAVCKGQ